MIWIQSPWVHIISSHWASPFYAVYCHPMLAVNFSAAKCQKKIRKLSIQILILGYLDKGLNQKYYFFTSGLISGQICLIVRMTYMVNIWSFGLEGKIKATIFLYWRFSFVLEHVSIDDILVTNPRCLMTQMYFNIKLEYQLEVWN